MAVSSDVDRSQMRRKRRRGDGATASFAPHGAVVDGIATSPTTSSSSSLAASRASDTAAGRVTSIVTCMGTSPSAGAGANARMSTALCGGRVAAATVVVAGWCMQGVVALKPEEDGVFFATGKARWGGGENVPEDKTSCNSDCDEHLIALPFYVVLMSVFLWVLTSSMGENETDFLREKVIISGFFVLVLYMMIFDWQKEQFIGTAG
mmetsp:Transcript_7557/g.19305  ORF Transcript_7557/g.19305 Transcript_7557/m.19305 type:complete len:207 (+) Transcript_7557:127-747(+)